MSIYIPYTYLIGWSSHNKWYYGVRYSRKSNPKELWKTYFTSSKHVKNYRQIFGDPDIIEIRKTFDCAENAQKWESKVLKKMKVVESDNWLNKTDNQSISVVDCLVGAKKPKSNKMRQKLSETKKGTKLSEETKEKISKTTKGRIGSWKGKTLPCSAKEKLSCHGKKLVGDKNPFFGKKHSEETKKKISESRKNKNSGSSHPFYGNPRSEVTKKKISETKNKKKLNTTNNNNNNTLQKE